MSVYAVKPQIAHISVPKLLDIVQLQHARCLTSREVPMVNVPYLNLKNWSSFLVHHCGILIKDVPKVDAPRWSRRWFWVMPLVVRQSVGRKNRRVHDMLLGAFEVYDSSLLSCLDCVHHYWRTTMIGQVLCDGCFAKWGEEILNGHLTTWPAFSRQTGTFDGWFEKLRQFGLSSAGTVCDGTLMGCLIYGCFAYLMRRGKDLWCYIRQMISCGWIQHWAFRLSASGQAWFDLIMTHLWCGLHN